MERKGHSKASVMADAQEEGYKQKSQEGSLDFQGVDKPYQLLSGMREGSMAMLAFCAFLGKVGSKGGLHRQTYLASTSTVWRYLTDELTCKKLWLEPFWNHFVVGG